MAAKLTMARLELALQKKDSDTVVKLARQAVEEQKG